MAFDWDRMFVRRVWLVGLYYLSFLLFGIGGLMLNAFCLIWPAGSERFFRRAIHRHLALFVGWLQFAGLMRIRWIGPERLLAGGCVVAANHPGLLDACYLLARIPDGVCLFKPSIRRNPVLGAAARRAGYLPGDGGPDMIRDAAAMVAEGSVLVIFPEGTRTRPGEPTGPFRSGFVLIAKRARAPIQLVRIACNNGLLAKGAPWWKPPALPGSVVIEVGPRIDVPPDSETAEVVQEAERSLGQC